MHPVSCSNPDGPAAACRRRHHHIRGVLTAASLAAAGVLASAQAQGLMDIGPPDWEILDLPLSGSFTSSLGWDSDAGSRSQGAEGRARRTSTPAGESMVWQNALNLIYGVNMKGRSSLSFQGNYSNSFYFDPPPGTDEMDHNFRASMRYRRQINRSFSLTNNTFVSYENDPNYDIGLSVNRPTSGYFLLANTLSGTYQWNRRLSTVTSYAFNTIVYEDQSLEGEGYRRHQFSNQFRYSFKRRLTGTLTYRYGFSEYEDNEEGDGVNQSLLAGVDYNWNRRTSVSFKAGVEHQSYDDAEREDEYAPRLEAAFGYVLGKRTNIRWSHSLGFDDTGRAGSLSGYTYRTYLSIGHGFSRRLNGSLSLSYVHSNFSDGVDDAPDSQEQSYFANAGLGYQLWRNISVQANYSYSLVTDDDDPEDYRRHRVFLGLMYSF